MIYTHVLNRDGRSVQSPRAINGMDRHASSKCQKTWLDFQIASEQ